MKDIAKGASKLSPSLQSVVRTFVGGDLPVIAPPPLTRAPALPSPPKAVTPVAPAPVAAAPAPAPDPAPAAPAGAAPVVAASTASTPIVLRYWPMQGRALSLFYMLEDSGVAYEREMHDGSPIDPTVVACPAVRVGGVWISQTMAATRALAEALTNGEGAPLYGVPKAHAAKHNQALLNVYDLACESFTKRGKMAHAGDAAHFVNTRFAQFLVAIEANYGDHPKASGPMYLGGADPCAVDFNVLALRDLARFLLGETIVDAKLKEVAPRTLAAAEAVAARPNVAAYIAGGLKGEAIMGASFKIAATDLAPEPAAASSSEEEAKAALAIQQAIRGKAAVKEVEARKATAAAAALTAGSAAAEEPAVTGAPAAEVVAAAAAAAAKRGSVLDTGAMAGTVKGAGVAAGADLVSFEFGLGPPLGMDLGALTLSVKGVEPGGQAEELGVGTGWRVTAVNGAAVATFDNFIDAVTAAKSAVAPDALNGGSVTVAFVRDSPAPDPNTTVVNKNPENFRPSVFAGPSDDDMQDPDDENMEGYLLKKGDNKFNPWQSRWFAARGHYLKYYKSFGDAADKGKCLAAIDLKFAVVKEAAVLPSKIFTLQLPGKDMQFKAANEDLCKKWVVALRALQAQAAAGPASP